MIIDFKPANGGGGGGGGDMSNYYTKAQVNALVEDFITATTDDLVNYYLKSETYAKGEVDSLIGAVSGFSYEIAPSTASVVNPQDNVLYLIGPDQTVSGDQYEEYVYSNNAWVKIGDTSIDLAGYVTTSDLNTALANYVTSTSLANTLAGYASLETISTVAISGSYNDLEDKLVAGEGIVIGAGNVISATGATTTLATVATTGDYDDLINKPVIPVVPELSTVATTGSYNDLTDKPTIPVVPELSTVATTGSYNDLTDKPVIPVVPELSTVATTGDYNDLTNTPSIPDAVSGVNDGTNWTSLTIGTTTKAIPGGGDMSDYYTKSQTDALVADFITATTDDLINYYLKSETYTQSEVDNLIGAVSGFSYEIAQSTSAVVDPQDNVLYLIGPYGSGSDQYEEYVYTNNTWTKIGDTSIDLSNYVTVNQLNTALGFYTTTQQLNLLLQNKQDVLTAGTGITISSNVISADSNVVSLTQAQYDALPVKDPDVIYIITDAAAITLSTVATSGSYNDLTDTPSIPDAVSGVNDGTNWTSITIGTTTKAIPAGGGVAQQQSDWAEDDTTNVTYIKNKPSLSTVATSGSYNDLTDKPVIPVIPTLATVATTGAYADLTGTPTLATVATSGSYNDLTDKPTIPAIPELATVATTGDYEDLTNKPVIPVVPELSTVATTGSYNDLTDKPVIPVIPELATVATTGDYDDLANKPSIPTVGAGTVTLTQNGSTIGTINVNDTNDKTIDIPGGGSGTQVQADWTEDDDSEPSYIQHKPALSTVATTGSYNDLTDKLTPGSHITISSQNVISGESNVVSLTQAEYDQITPEEDVIYVITDATPVTLATVATTGNYDDLTNKPSIPTVGAGTVTLTQNGSTIGTINVNDNDDKTIDIPGGGGGLGDDTIPLTISFNDGTTATYNVVVNNQI